MLSASPSDVRGPVAIITLPSGISVSSFSITLISECDLIFSVTASENALRSTANAPPASTEFAFAHGTVSEPSNSISALSSPAADSILAALRELEHTSSAKPL